MGAAPNFVQISPTLLAPRIPELGQIKIGGKGEERKARGSDRKYRLPVKYDHFVITKRTRDPQTDNLVKDEAIHRIVGLKPVELDVRLLFDRPEQNFQYFLAAYDGRSRRCSGNGVEAHDAVHGSIPCTCPWLKQHDGPYAGPKREIGRGAPVCKPHGRLSVILEAAESFGGFYTWRTTSWESVSSIKAQLDLYLGQFGYLSGLPLRMVLYPTTDTYVDENDVTKTSTSYKVALVLRGSFDTARQLASAAYERREQLALPPSPDQAVIHMKQLREAEEAEAEHIAQEFYPETQQAGETYIEVVGEVIDEEEEKAYARLEDLCRLTMELSEYAPDLINRQIAARSDSLDELAEKLKEKYPDAYAEAERRLTPEEEAGEPGFEEGAEAGDDEQRELL